MFPRLGLPFTIINQENEAFRKHSSNWRKSKTLALRLSVDEQYLGNGTFRKR